ncbi:HEAT repeat domain-containing protein [Corynebacterium sp. CCM 9203]|uniref:HEAT repeat domain-containing protein n=1 Tax=Corynebacterium sp. CCM 9203 TaxID=3057615 RepID=UPI00352454D2
MTERIGRKIRIKTNSGRAQTYNHGKNWVDFFALNVDDRFQSGFPVATSFALAEVECNGETWDWRSEINDSHDDIRFPAIKASRFHTIDEQVAASLLSVALDNANDWRVRVEALASLSWFDAKFIDHLKRWVISSKTKPDQQMEAVFALSEVGSSATQMALVEIANSVEVASDEVRAAAAWGLGTAGDIPVSHLLDLVGSENDLVALHAAAQLPSHMTTEMESRFTKWLAAGEHRLVSFAVHLADRLNDVPFLVKSLQRTTGNTRRVILLTLGDMPSDRTDGVLVNLSSSDRSVIETIQARRNDWLSAPERIGALDSLAIQSLRR